MRVHSVSLLSELYTMYSFTYFRSRKNLLSVGIIPLHDSLPRCSCSGAKTRSGVVKLRYGSLLHMKLDVQLMYLSTFVLNANMPTSILNFLASFQTIASALAWVKFMGVTNLLVCHVLFFSIFSCLQLSLRLWILAVTSYRWCILIGMQNILSKFFVRLIRHTRTVLERKEEMKNETGERSVRGLRARTHDLGCVHLAKSPFRRFAFTSRNSKRINDCF